ncbi:MAG: hypothetical protein HPY76_14235, partial [Anaerolineae bacterium]|nr:hypothetical protein [Anaerolineae bacterium]
ASQEWESLLGLLVALPGLPDFWLWFYLAFAISSTMTPSESDRRAWLPLMMVVLVLVGVTLLMGAGGWLSMHLAPLFDRAMAAAALVFAFSLGIHLVLGLPLMVLVRIIARFSGLRVA